MPVKFLIVSQRARKNIRKLPLHIHIKVISSLDKLKVNPLLGEKLQGELAGYYKFRVGDYRIVYRFSADVSQLEVVKIEHRQGVYR